MKRAIAAAAAALALAAQARVMPISEGRLYTDLDAAGHSITNLPDGFFAPAAAHADAALADFARTNEVVAGGPYLALTGGTMRLETSSDGIFMRNPGLALGGLSKTTWMKGGGFGVGPTMVNLGLEISGEWFDIRHWAFPGILRLRLPTDGDDWKLNDDGYPVEGGTLALRSDISPAVSNVVTKAYVEGLGIESGLQSESDPHVGITNGTIHIHGEEITPLTEHQSLANYATKSYADGSASSAVTPVSNKVEETSAIVNTWESYWGGEDVKLEVTNFYGNSTGELPRLRIREKRDGVWTNVWDEVDKFNVCKSEILGEVAASNRAVIADAEEKFAPVAWGRVTDKGSPNPVTNTTYMTSPQTYFGGGTEYQRVAVGSGAICVLVDKGALAHTVGEPGTFRFQDDGGTNYFGFVKTDSYTIGCRTDGIVPNGNLITLRYDVIMSGTDVPVVYWKEVLESAEPWTQLNNSDGTAASGAPYTVTWLQDGGSYYANINCGSNPSGFFKSETSVAGDVVWETNMKARLGGGIECTNTTLNVNGVVRPSYNGSSVIWTWSAR